MKILAVGDIVGESGVKKLKEQLPKIKKELFRLKDRNDIDMALGPTHEEAFTITAKNEIQSYKDLPLILYQIETKFRDEIRPRYGVIRSKEFIMKDAYSFNMTKESLDKDDDDIDETLNSVLDNDEKLEKMKQCAIAIAKPNSTKDICYTVLGRPY